MTAPIPVTLLTGFLGSGKTTLLNALLRDTRMDRAAVIINEFGEIGLDHDLIETASEATVLMPSGCLCCTLRGDLAQTLADLRDRRALGEIAFDRVVIETTGIADPGPIVQALVMDAELTFDFALDGVVATADIAAGPRILDQHFEAVQQIAMADRIVLTKGDLATLGERAAFEARLATLNPGAARAVADHGAIDPALLFGLAPRMESSKARTLDWVAAVPATTTLPPLSGLRAPKAARQTRLGGNGEGGGSHDGRITAQSIEIDAPIAPEVFDLWLEKLMQTAASRVLRLKGVVHVEGMAQPFALHAVQHIFHPPVPLRHWPEGDTTSRIVVVGVDMPPGYLDESLAFLRAKPGAANAPA